MTFCEPLACMNCQLWDSNSVDGLWAGSYHTQKLKLFCLYSHACETKTIESRCLWGVIFKCIYLLCHDKMVSFPRDRQWFISLMMAKTTWQLDGSLEYIHLCDSYRWFFSCPQLFLYAGNLDSLWFLLPRFSHILDLGSLGSNSRSSPLNGWFLMLPAIYLQTIYSGAGELQEVVPWHYFIWFGFYMLFLKYLGSTEHWPSGSLKASF